MSEHGDDEVHLDDAPLPQALDPNDLATTVQTMTAWMHQTQRFMSMMATRDQVAHNYMANNAARAPPAAPFAAAPVIRHGNLSKCTARFTGSGDNLNVFLSAVNAYRISNDVLDANAIISLPCLLLDQAGLWWESVKQTVHTWIEFERIIKFNFGEQWTNPLVMSKFFALVHQPHVTGELFVSECRGLLSHLSAAAQVSQHFQIDMIYAKLHVNLRGRFTRAEINNFDELIARCRSTESLWREAGLMPTIANTIIQPVRPPVVATAFTSKPISTNNSSSGPTTEFRCPQHKSNKHQWERCRFNPASPFYEPPGVSQAQNFNQQTVPKQLASATPPPNNNNIARSSPIMATAQPLSALANANLPRCFKCHATGHISSNCPSARADPPKSEKVESAAVNFDLPFPRSRIYTTANFNGFQQKAMIDGGSSHCQLNTATYDHLKGTCLFEERNCVVTLGNGLQYNTRSYVLLVSVTIGNDQYSETFDFPFIYSPDEPFPEVMIGLDLIGYANIDVDYAKRHWCFRNHSDIKFPALNCISSHAVQFILQDGEATMVDNSVRQQLQEMMAPYAEVFEDFGPPSTLGTHRIPTGKAEPVASHPYQIPAKRRFRVQQLLTEMEANNIIEPCESPWAAPLVCIVKPSGDLRLCVDYRKLNAVTAFDRYPMPSIEQLLFRTDKRNCVSLLDLKSGFWQIPVAEEDRDKTAFTCGFGLYRFTRMPFGLKGAPATFQRAMDSFARSIPNVRVYPYLDDLIVISPSPEQHLQDLNTVFNRFDQTNLRVNRDKCQFFCQEFKYLGHIVTPEGIRTDPSKVAAIIDFAPPRNIKQLQSFISTCSWYRRFVPDFAKIAKPLTALLAKDQKFVWSALQQAAFLEIKQMITTAPCLATADVDKPFFLFTDASSYALGAVLCQGSPEAPVPIEYASRLLIPAERNYNTTDREALAIIWALDKFRGYLECNHVLIMTDHQALKWLMNLKSPHGRLARWSLEIQGYDAQIQYIPGKQNVIADMLSRPFLSDELMIEVAACEVSFGSTSVADIRAKLVRVINKDTIEEWCQITLSNYSEDFY